MNAELELLQAYREWQRLTRAEARAIRTGNWNLLADCQCATKDYESMIGTLTAEARNEWQRTGQDCVEKEGHVQVLINDLIETTRHNQSMLQAAKNVASAQLVELAEAGRKLKLLHRSYGHSHFAGPGE